MPYSEEKANRVINFIRQLKLTKGKWAGKLIIREIFGTIKPNGYRQFNTVAASIFVGEQLTD